MLPSFYAFRWQDDFLLAEASPINAGSQPPPSSPRLYDPRPRLLLGQLLPGEESA